MTNPPIYLKKQIVDIVSGDVRDMLTTVLTSTLDGSTRTVGWRMSELRKDGQPDQRAKESRIGVVTDSYSGGLRGYCAEYVADRETRANVLRSAVADASAALLAARQALLNLYV